MSCVSYPVIPVNHVNQRPAAHLRETPVQNGSVLFRQHSSYTMADIKFQYFDLRVKGEAARLLLAYGGLK